VFTTVGDAVVVGLSTKGGYNIVLITVYERVDIFM
jgi:hypothetical protein